MGTVSNESDDIQHLVDDFRHRIVIRAQHWRSKGKSMENSLNHVIMELLSDATLNPILEEIEKEQIVDIQRRNKISLYEAIHTFLIQKELNLFMAHGYSMHDAIQILCTRLVEQENEDLFFVNRNKKRQCSTAIEKIALQLKDDLKRIKYQEVSSQEEPQFRLFKSKYKRTPNSFNPILFPKPVSDLNMRANRLYEENDIQEEEEEEETEIVDHSLRDGYVRLVEQISQLRQNPLANNISLSNLEGESQGDMFLGSQLGDEMPRFMAPLSGPERRRHISQSPWISTFEDVMSPRRSLIQRRRRYSLEPSSDPEIEPEYLEDGFFF